MVAFLGRRWPEIEAEYVEFSDEGWDYRIVIVDDDVVFRLPRTSEHARRLAVDIGLLNALEDRLPIAIPTPTFVSEDPPVMGYRKIPGTSIDPSDLAAHPAEARRLGRFLDALHRVPVDLATELGVAERDAVTWRDQWRRRWDWLQKAVPLLPESERSRAAQGYEEFIADDRNFEFDPALVHHDLGPWNILWDRDHVSGIIDWSDAQIGDPAIDFAWFAMQSPAIIEAVLTDYSARSLGGLLRRARFFEWAGGWSEAAYGLDRGDDAYVQMGVAKILAQLD